MTIDPTTTTTGATGAVDCPLHETCPPDCPIVAVVRAYRDAERTTRLLAEDVAETDPTTTTEPAARLPRRLCAHADGDAPMHWLEPGERCSAEPTRERAARREPEIPAEADLAALAAYEAATGEVGVLPAMHAALVAAAPMLAGAALAAPGEVTATAVQLLVAEGWCPPDAVAAAEQRGAEKRRERIVEFLRNTDGRLTTGQQIRAIEERAEMFGDLP